MIDIEASTTYSGAVLYLNEVFDLLNKEFFENTLSKPTITIQSTPKALGHFTTDDIWDSSSGRTHEVNIGAGTLGRPIAAVVTTLLHEMVHYYNHTRGVQDCSRNGTYHNKSFKKAAEEHGLVVKKDGNHGWACTSPGERVLDFVARNNLTDIQLNRTEAGGSRSTGSAMLTGTDTLPETPKSSTRKYVCPRCGNSVRATKTVNIACMDCNRQMIVAVRTAK